MVSAKSVEDQLKRIGFSNRTWNHAESAELTNILLPGEEVFECVNGWYEGGFALLAATDLRILLVDKKPLKFLTVEDLRFDMINQIDYGHRFLDAHISVSAGAKSLRFRSYNKERLRKLIGHVQHRMAEIKIEQSTHSQNQQEHLKQIDQQLQTYLIAQYQQHESMRRQIAESDNRVVVDAEPSPRLADSLAPSLTVAPAPRAPAEQLKAVSGWANGLLHRNPTTIPNRAQAASLPNGYDNGVSSDELYNEGMKEIYGNRQQNQIVGNDQNLMAGRQAVATAINNNPTSDPVPSSPLELNPLRIAYSKLPLVLRNRQYGRTSLKRSSSEPSPSVAPLS